MHNKQSIKHIEASLSDLQLICDLHYIDYRVVGSTAIIGAVNSVHRIPGDVDVLFDINKKDLLYRELERLGYKKETQDFPIDILPEKLIRFIKGDQIIEPRGGEFTNNYLEYKLSFPLFLGLRIPLRLIFSNTMSKPITYKIGKAKFTGLSREALWVGLTSFINSFENLKDKVEKRKLDILVLSENLNKTNLEKIINEEPGIYFKRFPLITTKKKILESAINYFLRSK